MHVRVKLQSLIPTMQHTEEADLGAEVARIARNFQQRFCARMKQQVEDHLLVLQGHRSKLPRQSEHGVHVASGQQFRFPRSYPAQAGVALTAWTMPVAT